MSQPPPIVLSFAASDSTGGAGIQADILTLASMGCHPLSVITAITVQDTAGVDDVMALDPEWVADQARAVLEDMPVHVFKIGMLGSVEIITAIAEVVSDYPNIPLVLDPVLARAAATNSPAMKWWWQCANCCFPRRPSSRPTAWKRGDSPRMMRMTMTCRI